MIHSLARANRLACAVTSEDQEGRQAGKGPRPHNRSIASDASVDSSVIDITTGAESALNVVAACTMSLSSGAGGDVIVGMT